MAEQEEGGPGPARRGTGSTGGVRQGEQQTAGGESLPDVPTQAQVTRCLIHLGIFQSPAVRPDDSWRRLLPEGGDPEGGWKKTMTRLVTVYHPDKLDKEVHGEKYYVLCEQITMELTKRLASLKL